MEIRYIDPSVTDSFLQAAVGSGAFYINIAVAFIFLAIGGFAIWMYYRNKNDSSLMDKYGNKSWGSFKGYWARYRNHVWAFTAAIGILFGLAIFLWAFGIIGDVTYDAI